MTEIIAYLDDNKNWEKEDIPATQLTIINYAFANIMGLSIVRDLKKIHLINELKASHPHLKTCISIGGWSAGGFSEGVATKENREILIQNLLTYMQKYNFNGIDLDWEYPGMDVAGIAASPADAQNFLFFVAELRAALNQLSQTTEATYLLTAAIGAAKELLDTMCPIGDYRYIDYLDFVNVMTYDMRGSFTKIAGHHTNLYSYEGVEGALSVDQAVKNLLARGVEPQKIVIGGAFYSRIWSGFASQVEQPIGKQAQSFGNKTMDWNELSDLLKKQAAFVFWDEQAQAPYYFDGERFISYDDARSLAAKANYVKEKGLRGMMYWEHSLDLSLVLLEAITEILQA
ncbi:glycoside hydrolase family 18 protein [Enterococcus lemanii]|uniref:chitinase n=1 Tax=Enterococcus lemanii TaxID=1159752 RepID=A0ABV9MX69_9ENTE|nr:glycoside hydrolase family 18 protein [Enterococcus lemanii]MBM7708119.1 chitinase [Enterococcus lemanii]